MGISDLIYTAFRQSATEYSEIHRLWIDASQKLGNLLPESLLIVSIQRAGELDLVLRCMEDERVIIRSEILKNHTADFTINYQSFLSELWIGQLYEIMRLIQARKLVTKPNQFENLAHKLRLIRVTIEKHEIAADRKLEAPLIMKKNAFFNEKIDYYHYSKEDATRSHIMPTTISNRGSYAWQATDIATRSVQWLERRSLSEQFLAEV